MGLTAKLKYVVIDDGLTDAMYIFMDHITHANFAAHLYGTVLSAGFIRDGKCFGESISLKVKARPEDTELFSRLMSEDD